MINKADLQYEYQLRQKGYHHIAGLDEVGRGAWAGPVVAGAVILPLDRLDLRVALAGVDDSKRLTPKKREVLLPRIQAVAIAAGVGFASHTEIDRIGILDATRLAMRRALASLTTQPNSLLTDAMWLPEIQLPCMSLIKGDQLSLSIAAASILAKVTRDRYMVQQDELYPPYGFRSHKGYGTAQHRQALEQTGPCNIHRMTFAPMKTFRKRSNS